MNFVWKTDEGEAGNIFLLIFCPLGVLQFSVGEGCLVKAESFN